MGGQVSVAMSDVGVMARQLASKELQIAQLQGQLAEKLRRVDDMEGQVSSKDRSIYYLERDMDARSRALGKLRLQTTNLSQVAAKLPYGAQIDAKQLEVDAAQGQVDNLMSQADEASVCLKHVKALKDIYEAVTLQIQRLGNVNAEKVVELLQAQLNAVETENGKQKQLRDDMAVMKSEVQDELVNLQGKARMLEQL